MCPVLNWWDAYVAVPPLDSCLVLSFRLHAESSYLFGIRSTHSSITLAAEVVTTRYRCSVGGGMVVSDGMPLCTMPLGLTVRAFLPLLGRI
ncbi:MAG: hypothetical protein NVS4B8_19030 [Herpetosiphon sp.]